jgi:hypothetical protein
MSIHPENLPLVISVVLAECQKQHIHHRLKRLETVMRNLRAWMGWTDAECDEIEAAVKDGFRETS